MMKSTPRFAAPARVMACVSALALSTALLVVVAPSASAQTAAGCEAPRASTGRSIGRSILGRVIGDATSRAASRLGYAERFVPSAEVADTLTESIACHLDEQEQLKAKDATLDATRSETVGTRVEWTSESRENVRGSSTIVAREDRPADQPSGSACMMVDDIIIVNGEETRSQKRMCRVPPSRRYTLAA